MFGKGYMVDYCIALYYKEQREKIKIKSLAYIAQGVQCVVNGLASEEVLTPFADFINETPEETRTAEEIVDDVLTKCGLLRG